MSYNTNYRTGQYVYTPPTVYVPVGPQPPVLIVPPYVDPYRRHTMPYPPRDVYVGRSPVTDVHTSRRGNTVIDQANGSKTVVTQNGRVIHQHQR